MSSSLTALCATAASIGLLHTLLGPDHYVPFVAMARAGRWSAARTLVVTVCCGIAHVLGSIVIGVVGIALGVAVFKLDGIESARADVAGWLLLAFGLAYMAWGLRRAVRNRPHTHWHAHSDGTVHRHEHTHVEEHAHVHTHTDKPSLTPWILFTIFVFGPCEPLIPLLMYPAARASWWGVVSVTAVFALTTIGTMTVVVMLGYFGFAQPRFASLERYSHALAGFALACCGLAIKIGL